MLYCNRVDISEAVGVNETSATKRSIVCHYCYFSVKWFKFQPNVCNGCYNVLMMFMKLNDIAILNIRGVESRYITH